MMEIYGFPYLDPSHKLRFTMGILSAASTTTLDQIELQSYVRQVVGAESSMPNFIDVPTTALVDGQTVTVPIHFNFSVADTDLGNWKLTSIIRPYLIKGGLVATSRTVQVTFPAGSQNITWIPCFGFGRGPILPVQASSPTAPETLETEFAAPAQQNQQQHFVMFFTFAIVGGLILLAIIYNLGCYTYKNRKSVIKIEETKQTNVENDTSGQREQDKLLVTQTPSTYQALA